MGNPGQQAATVPCPTGFSVLSGGARVAGIGALVESYPSSDLAWTSRVLDIGDQQVTFYAVCARAFGTPQTPPAPPPPTTGPVTGRLLPAGSQRRDDRAGDRGLALTPPAVALLPVRRLVTALTRWFR